MCIFNLHIKTGDLETHLERESKRKRETQSKKSTNKDFFFKERKYIACGQRNIAVLCTVYVVGLGACRYACVRPMSVYRGLIGSPGAKYHV